VIRNGQTTLGEVARKCAVSQSTVSRVLNNAKHGRFSVSDDVRQRIVEAARELNYRPSVAARNLTARKTNLVAVLGLPGIWSERVGPAEEAVGALSTALDLAGYEICLQFWSERHGRYDPPPLRVDGVIAVDASSQEQLGDLENSGIPYVSLNGVAGPSGSQVIPDDAQGTLMALDHLVQLGHRRIAYVDNLDEGASHPSVLQRREAFARARQTIGFESPEVEHPQLRNQPWDPFLEPFLRRSVIQGGVTAVLAYSHHIGLMMLRAAHELGLAVPRDFSLICFNNSPLVRLSVPSLTAVDVPAVSMGQAAADLLVKHMTSDGPFPPAQVRVEESLIVRESTAAPKARAGI
jgi:LacI family transcriptional regulator